MLRPHETPLDIPLTLTEAEDPALQLFGTEGAATGNRTGPSVSRPAGSSVALDETLPLTHLSYKPDDFGAERLATSLGPSRLLVGALLSAPAVLFLAAWFVAGSSSTRRAAIEAAQRLRSEMAPPPARDPNEVPAAQPPTVPESQAPAASAVAAGTATDTLQSTAPPAAESETVSSEPASRASRRASAKTSGTGEPLAGTLSIDSRPIGASVFIDEQLVGTTPMLLPQISPGAHSLRLHLDAHRDWKSTVQIDPDARNRVTAGLEEDENVPVGANLR